MLVQIRWQGRKVAVPLSPALNPDESTDEAVGDWHYWVAQGYYARPPKAHDCWSRSGWEGQEKRLQ
jgi:hypothetical protein